MGKARMTPVGPTSRVACFLITNLPVKAERGHYPILRRRPLVIVERIGIRDIVLDSSPEAIGVAPGMALGEALRACGKATVVQADRNHYQDADDRIVDALQRRFGAVLRAGMGRVYLSLDGAVAAPYGEAQLVSTLLQAAPAGFAPRVGVGSGRFIAYALAASLPDGGAARAPVDSEAFLRECSVDLLPIPPAQAMRLRQRGVNTLGTLADAPYGEVQAILGGDAQRMRNLARGEDADTLPSAFGAAA